MEIPRYWRLRKQRYAMVGETCPTCNANVFPPRPVCPYCSEANRQRPTLVAQPAVVLTYGESVDAIKR